MKQSEWKEKFLEAVSASCEEGREAVDYIQDRGTRISIRRARKSVGALWTIFRSIRINKRHYSQESSLTNPHAWVMLIHEVRHLQQGFLTALSIYGELDAWQYEFRVWKKLGRPLHPLAEEILSLPLNTDRDNLRRAQQLMTRYAGIWYGAFLLPLYPLHKEINFWFTRNY
jgi:hypothetical protein